MQTQITSQQQQKLVEYLDEARSKHMHLIYICIAGAVLLFLPGLSLLTAGEFSNLYVSVAGFFWIVSIIGLVILLLTGYQKYFGGNSAISCAKRGAYSCAPITVSSVSGSEGRPPYLLNDSAGNQYICPVYIEFKYLHAGSMAIGVTLVNGMRFAFCEPGANS